MYQGGQGAEGKGVSQRLRQPLPFFGHRPGLQSARIQPGARLSLGLQVTSEVKYCKHTRPRSQPKAANR